MDDNDLNPAYYPARSPNVIMRLNTICHDAGMKAYFKWMHYSRKVADEEYHRAYFAELRKFAPEHPHLRYAPEGV